LKNAIRPRTRSASQRGASYAHATSLRSPYDQYLAVPLYGQPLSVSDGVSRSRRTSAGSK
jgi:hypothetical protein